MDDCWDTGIHIPEDLSEVILRGISQGKKRAARRSRIKRLAVRSLCSFALMVGLLAGGVRVSPAFAAAVRDLPVIGELVRVFEKNQPLVQGGGESSDGQAALTMERSGDTEQMRLEFGQEDASVYRAEFASYPKTVTVTLPGTRTVEILSEISRAGDTSQYIKSVCLLPSDDPETAAVQLELESDADVEIREYRNPGSLVIRLTPAGIQMDTVYSVRTLSLDAADLEKAMDRYGSYSYRVLRDDTGTFFLEFAQCATQAEAEQQGRNFPGDVIVEARAGNNVPVCFGTMEAYQSNCFLEQYYQILRDADQASPVLEFMDRHFAQAGEQERDVMLRGLSGLLQDEEEPVDWEKAASFYRMAGQELPDYVQQHLR